MDKVVLEAMQIVDVEDAGSVDNIVRLVIFYIMVVILFPNKSGSVKTWMCAYLDDLDWMGLFSWGKYAYELLVGHVSATTRKLNKMKKGEKKIMCLGGPMFDLQAWLYEHTKRWDPTDAGIHPRYR